MGEQTNCPDCGRVKASSRANDEWEAFEDVDCFAEYLSNTREMLKCKAIALTRLRSELESAQAATREALKVCRESGVRIGQLEGEAIFLRSELQQVYEALHGTGYCPHSPEDVRRAAEGFREQDRELDEATAELELARAVCEAAPGMLELSAMTEHEDGIKERFYDALAVYKAHKGGDRG